MVVDVCIFHTDEQIWRLGSRCVPGIKFRFASLGSKSLHLLSLLISPLTQLKLRIAPFKTILGAGMMAQQIRYFLNANLAS